MAFDAGLLAHIIKEINDTLSGGRVEKIYQPAKDEFIFIIRSGNESHRLLINAGSRCPRIGITQIKTENPAKAPMLCMFLRKHLQGAVFRSAKQLGFERAADLIFNSTDELGFKQDMHVIVEMMGKYSNIVITNDDGKILNILRQIDFTQSMRRQMLPGMTYEAPPAQNKKDPFSISTDEFNRLCAADVDRVCEKYIVSEFSGISPLVAREATTVCGGSPSATLRECSSKLTEYFFNLLEVIKSGSGIPNIVFDEKGIPKEYSFVPITQYGSEYSVNTYSTFGEMLDIYFAERSREEKISQKASDILKIISNSEQRIQKKLSLLAKELADCSEGEKYKLCGDLITANIYMLRRGMSGAELVDYNTGEPVNVLLDTRLTPAQNAQKYYKKYTKSKSAKEHLSEQIELSRREYEYIESVKEALSHATSEKELSEIRSELYHSGYASRMKSYAESKKASPSYLTFKTTNGYTALCGKNNTANDFLTFRHADKGDWWFHAKNLPGSHVILECAGLPEPPAVDFTDAANIAAVYSKASDSPVAEIDYTKVKHVKKPPNSKPGFVIYHTNWSASVNVDKARAEAQRVK